MNKLGFSNIIVIIFLLLFSLITFTILFNWATSFQSNYSITIEKNSLNIEISDFKNGSIIISSSSNTILEKLIIENSNNNCSIVNKTLNKTNNVINISSCTLNKGEVYSILAYTPQDMKKIYLAYR